MAKRFTVEAVFKAIDKISSPTSKMSRGVKKFAAQAVAAFNKAGDRVKALARNIKEKLGQAFKVALTGALVGSTFAIKSFVTEAAKIEDVTAAFTPLLGGAEKARKLVDMLNETAATTPFQFEDISKSAKQLLPVMNGDIEKVVSTFRMLGDTAGGNAQKLDSITRGFTKAMLKGKVDMESLNMIAGAGVPIFTELAASMGVAPGEKFFKMISRGEVSTEALNKTFQRMTKSGGIFFKGMQIASETFNGKISTLKDNLALTSAEIGSALLPMFKDFVDSAIKITSGLRQWVKANKELIGSKIKGFMKVLSDIFKAISPAVNVIIQSLGRLFKVFANLFKGVGKGNKAFEILVGFLDFIAGAVKVLVDVIVALDNILGGNLVQTILIIVAAIKAFSIAMGILNIVLNANPIVLIITAVAAILLLLITNWDKVSKAISMGLEVLGELFKIVWDAISTSVIGVLKGIKFAFLIIFNSIKFVLLTLADLVLNIFGNLTRAILGFIVKVGEVIGIKLSGIQQVVDNIAALQKSVKDELKKPIIPDEDEDMLSSDTKNPKGSEAMTETGRANMQRNKESSESVLVIKDETGRAELSAPTGTGKNVKIKLKESGGL